MDDTPQDLHELNYARKICEDSLGWPAKGNLELIADCITSISKCKKLPIVKAFKYLERAISLAKQQCQDVDPWWFREGKYMLIRPQVSEKFDDWSAPDARLKRQQERQQIEAFQSTPEFSEGWKQLEETFGKIVATPIHAAVPRGQERGKQIQR